MSSNTISQSLGVADTPLEGEVIPSIGNTTLTDDYHFSRENIRSVLKRGSEALDKMLEIADLSQHPRSYEVVAELIKALSETNKDLLELTQKQKRIEAVDARKTNVPGAGSTNYFIGSTADLQRLIHQQKQVLPPAEEAV